MPYLFTCPHCQTKTQVEDRYSGLRGECVTCGEPIEIPAFAEQRTNVAKSNPQTKQLSALAIAGVVLVLLLFLLYAVVRQGSQTVSQLQTNRMRAASIRNLETIAEALNAYAADHGTYPPAYTKNKAGQPLQSWRVLILPYLGEEEIDESINKNLAWDAPDNISAAYNTIPSVYRHPGNGAGQTFGESAYFLITGPATLFPNTGPLALSNITDDLTKTLLVVEGAPSMMNNLWTEPVDLDVTLLQGIGGSKNDIGGLIEGGAAVATVDGRGHFIDENIPLPTLRALISPRGGEPLADDTLD